MTSQDEFFDFIDSLSQYDNMYPPIPKFILEASFHVLEIHTFGGNIPNRTKSKPSLVVSTAKWTTPKGIDERDMVLWVSLSKSIAKNLCRTILLVRREF